MTDNLELDDTGRAYVKDLVAKRTARKAAQEAEDRAKARLVEFMGSAKTGSLAGQIVVERVTVTTRRFDTTAFKKNSPDLYDAFVKASESERVNIADDL